MMVSRYWRLMSIVTLHGAGKQWAVAEKEADNGQRRLVQSDPLPQAMFLVKVKPGEPMILHARLQIAR